MPHPLRSAFVGHEVRTARWMGWGGIRNGELLRLAVEAGFDALITVDRNLPFQQNIARFNIRVIVLAAPSNRMDDVEPLIVRAREALAKAEPGEVVEIRVE